MCPNCVHTKLSCSAKIVTYYANIKSIPSVQKCFSWRLEGSKYNKFSNMVKVLIADSGWGQNKTDSFAIALQPLYCISISFSAQNKQLLNCMKSSFANLQFIDQLKKLNVTSLWTSQWNNSNIDTNKLRQSWKNMNTNWTHLL